MRRAPDQPRPKPAGHKRVLQLQSLHVLKHLCQHASRLPMARCGLVAPIVSKASAQQCCGPLDLAYASAPAPGHLILLLLLLLLLLAALTRNKCKVHLDEGRSGLSSLATVAWP
jgi:hypothetical protein